jgi:DNA repair protein SbcC/Rad50
MIEVKYKLERDEGDGERIFQSDVFPSSFDNLVLVEGPNASGKSTLLNIIALGLFGMKNKEIPKSLHMKMASLLNTDYNKLTFSMKITNHDGSLTLLSEKNDPNNNEIKLYEIIQGQKKSLGPDLFERRYNLIYDIPIDPTNRLVYLTHVIRDTQVRYGNRVGELRAQLHELIQDIRQSKDPKRVEELRQELKRTDHDIEVKEKAGLLMNDELTVIEKYVYFNLYQEYFNECDRLNKEIQKIEKAEKRVVNSQRRATSKYSELSTRLKNAISEMQREFNTATGYLRSYLPKNEQSHLQIWEDICLSDTLKSLSFDRNLSEKIIHFEKVLTSLVDKQYETKNLKEAQFYGFLLQFLQSFKDLDIVLPGGKSIQDFISECDKKKNRFESVLTSATNLNKTKELLISLKTRQREIEIGLLSELQEIRNCNPEIFEEQEQESYGDNEELGTLKNRLEAYTQKFDFYEGEWIKKGRPEWTDLEPDRSIWEKFIGCSEEQMKSEIARCESDIVDTKAKLVSLNATQQRLSIRIQELEKQKDHPLRHHLKYMEDELEPAINSLQQKLNSRFEKYISEIINETAKHSKDKESEKYYSAVFSFLAKRIGYIRHIDGEYKITSVDLIDKIIKTESKKVIPMIDISTGQGQLTYLMGKLNTSDNRKIIALLDEVAMMYGQTREKIYDTLKDMYKKDRLLAGIIVQPGDKIKLISKI